MLIKNIEVGFDATEKILHIADIHIRNYKRHKEYRQVFRKLYKEARKTPKETVIYVGGDIVHTKTDISPELIAMVSDFFNTLAKIRPTIVITGNHDANLNNPSRLDSLSPIIRHANTSQRHRIIEKYPSLDPNTTLMIDMNLHHKQNTPLKTESTPHHPRTQAS